MTLKTKAFSTLGKVCLSEDIWRMPEIGRGDKMVLSTSRGKQEAILCKLERPRPRV